MSPLFCIEVVLISCICFRQIRTRRCTEDMTWSLWYRLRSSLRPNVYPQARCYKINWGYFTVAALTCSALNFFAMVVLTCFALGVFAGETNQGCHFGFLGSGSLDLHHRRLLCTAVLTRFSFGSFPSATSSALSPVGAFRLQPWGGCMF